MNIYNAKIKNATVCLDDRNTLSATMSFETSHGCCTWGFVLTVPTESECLIKLMNYTSASNINNLNGKIIRLVKHENFLCGFGDPIKDKFIPLFGEELKEVTESQFEELLKNK